MRKNLLAIFTLVSLLTASLILADSPSAIRSRQLFMLGAEHDHPGEIAEATELYRRAYELDPSNLSARWEWGKMLLFLAKDSTETMQAQQMLADYIDAYPYDYDNGLSYARLLSVIYENYGLPDSSPTEMEQVLKRIHNKYPDRLEPLTMLEEYYQNTHEIDSVFPVYDELERILGPSSRLGLMRAGAYLAKGDTTSMWSELDQQISDSDDPTGPLITKGLVFDYLEQGDSAFYYLRMAEQRSPNASSPKLSIAQWYDHRQDSINHDAYIYKALMCDDMESEEMLQTLRTYTLNHMAHNPEDIKVARLLDTALSQFPYDAGLHQLAGAYYSALGKYEPAMEHYRRASELEPEDDSHVISLARCMIMSGDYAEAVKLDNELKGQIQNLNYDLLMSGAYQGIHDYTTALALTDTVIAFILPETDPGLPLRTAEVRRINADGQDFLERAYLQRGDILYLVKDYDRAFTAYDNALKLNPMDAMALNNYAYYILMAGGDTAKALDLIRKALEIQPDVSIYLDTYAWALFKSGDYPSALEQMQKAFETATEDEMGAELYEHMGDILFMNNEIDQAVDNWKKAQERDNDNAALRAKIKNKSLDI